MSFYQRIRLFIFVFIALFLVACGGGGSKGENDDITDQQNRLTGIFVDSPVVNIRYHTESLNGYTNNTGEFQYLAGENITFSIGGIELPSTPAKKLITPFDIANSTDPTNPLVSNIARLLQSLDDDQDSSNGLQIPQSAHDYEPPVTINFDSDDFEELVAELIVDSESSSLISEGEAISHLLKSVIGSSDQDQDTITNLLDNCVLVANSSQSDLDEDGIGDACDQTPLGPDDDLDGVPNLTDNCPETLNADQVDSDEDGFGNACDETPLGPDTDGDEIPDSIDTCPAVANADQNDKDGDGTGDVCDDSPLGNDKDAPVAQIMFPPQYSFSTVGTVTIRGTTTDETHVETVSVNGHQVTTFDNFKNWSLDLSLSEGINDIVVQTSDSINSSENSDSIQIQVSGPPIVSPRDIAVDDESNKVFWLDRFGAVISADIATKDRAQILVPEDQIDLLETQGLAIDSSSGFAYISDSELNAVFSLALDTGEINKLSTCPALLPAPVEIVLDKEAGRLFVLDSVEDHVVEVGIDTGNCNLLFSKTSKIRGLSWDPAERKIYFGNGPLYAFAESTGETLFVADAMQAPFSGHVKHVDFDVKNDRVIWLSGNDVEDTYGLYLLDIDTNEISTISDNVGVDEETEIGVTSTIDLSPDGENVLLMAQSRKSLLSISIETGEHKVLMPKLVSDRDQGPEFLFPKGIDIDEEHAYIIDGRRQAVMKMDLETGDREIYLEAETSFSPFTMRVERLQVDRENKQLYLLNDVDVIPDQVFINDALPEFIKIDLETNQQTLISAARSIGNEPDLHYASDFTLDIERNRLLVVDSSPDEIVAVDLNDGERTVFSGDGVPNYDQWFSQIQYAVMDRSSNRVLVKDTSRPALFSVDADSGNRSIFSEEEAAVGLYAIDNVNQRLFSVRSSVLYSIDLLTKEISTVSDWSSHKAPNRITAPNTMAYSESKKVLYITDDQSMLIFAVDAETGARVILAD